LDSEVIGLGMRGEILWVKVRVKNLTYEVRVLQELPQSSSLAVGCVKNRVRTF
jgi:hypothetical protein